MNNKIVSLLILTVCLVLSSAANAGNNPNLVGYWKLDEASGRIASDSSGTGNDGQLIGGVGWAPADGKWAGAASFDGSNSSRIEISAAGITPTEGTVALWVYLAEPQSKEGRNGYRFLFGYGRRPNRIQLYMDNNNTQLDLGLGDQHRKHENIVNLSTETWHYIALTWDKGDYTVYINGDEKVVAGTYTGLKSLPSAGDIGNNGNESEQASHGLIDEVVIFDHALNKNEIITLYEPGKACFADEPTLIVLLGEVRKTNAIIKEQNSREAAAFLERKIAEYEQWESKNSNDIALPYKALAFDLYFLLAKSKETAGLAPQDIIAAYKQSVSRLIPTKADSALALLWLFKNTPADDYMAAVKKCVHNNNFTPHNIHHIVKYFEASGNWPAFKLFSDVVFSESENPVAFAKSVERGLTKNGAWEKRYLEYCKSKSQLTNYVFEKDCEVAEEYVAKEDFRKAAEIYRGIVKQYDSSQHKTALELEVCKCLFKGGEYQSAISELDRFIAENKTTNRVLTEKAMLMKGRCYLQLDKVDKASDELLTIVTEYPESEQTPEANYFLGYSYMLQSRYEEATDAFNIVVQDYPQSDYASNARLYLTRIENMLD